MAGQTLSVRCQYPPRGGPYQSKGWCKEVSKFTCLRLVTSSRPRTLTQISQSSIWDDPAAGFFIVTMTGLKEQDSGHYWCRIYHTSGNSVDRSLRFYLAVSPGEPLPRVPSLPFGASWFPSHGSQAAGPLSHSRRKAVGDVCPGDAHMCTHTHTLTHSLSRFTSLLKDAQTEQLRMLTSLSSSDLAKGSPRQPGIFGGDTCTWHIVGTQVNVCPLTTNRPSPCWYQVGLSILPGPDQRSANCV